MARSRENKIELTAYDDLFQTDESRAEAGLSKIRDIPISEIDEFPDHPFKVLMNEDMEQLVESVKRNGVMTPATVRLKEDGRYELISGHRRKTACELAGLETLKCEVKELTRDEAIIVMVESNLQRSVILPSEKAFAYKMRLEVMKRQAGRPTKENYSPVGNNSEFATSSDELAEKVGESKNQIFRYIRLTELVPEILQMVDDRQIAFRPAVEISYLSEEQQYTLLEAMQYNDATEEHLTVTQFKVQAEQQRLEAVTGQVAQAKRGLENAKAATEKQKKKLEALQKETKTAKTVALTVQEIETMGKKATFGNNITLTPDECDTLKRYAVNGIIANADNKRLKEKLASAEKTVSIWKQRYEAVSEKYMELKQKAQPFLDALEIASERVRAFLDVVLSRGKETQEHEHTARKRGQDMEL